jgi:hypothetical protein
MSWRNEDRTVLARVRAGVASDSGDFPGGIVHGLRDHRSAAVWLKSLLVTLTCLGLSACESRTVAPAARVQDATALPSPWPRAADYTTIRIAREVMFHSLLYETDWRRRATGASLGMRTLLTVRLAPGRCAEYVGRLYAELMSLADGYAGEDWRPLVRLVRHDPPVWQACAPPPRRPHNLSL